LRRHFLRPYLLRLFAQRCQIFLGTNIPKREKYTKWPINYIYTIYKSYQMTEKYSQWSFSIPRPSKFYPKWDFWFENKASGNPARKPKCPQTPSYVIKI
jgi:hypothetical protein